MNLRDRYYWWRRRATNSAPSGPTVLLNAAYLTDTLLNDAALPIANGDSVASWATATGGTFTQALADAAGADSTFCIFTTADGVQTGGNNAALTTATPITIPANADCVIYAKCVYAGGDFYLFGKSDGASYIQFDENNGAAVKGDGGGSAGTLAYPVPGSYLFRARRASNVWRFAWTGQSDFVADSDTLAGGAVTVDTLLAANSMASFSASGNYLQKIYIRHGTSAPDTAYETSNGGAL